MGYATGMEILPVEPRHIPALSALAIRTFCDTFAFLYPPEDLKAFLAKSYAQDKLAAEVADPAQFWRMVWDESGLAVAYLQCGPVTLPHAEADPATQGELKRLYVDQRAQGKGLGRQLMTVALDHLAERYGDAPQWIGVWADNHKAQALYDGYGFIRAGEYQFAVGNCRDDEFILRRQP